MTEQETNRLKRLRNEQEYFIPSIGRCFRISGADYRWLLKMAKKGLANKTSGVQS
jgi:hypothetical protein